METARKIVSNTFAQVGAKFINALISVLIVRFITGYMAEAGYGRYTLVYEFVAFFGIAIDLGLFTILVDRMAKDKGNIPTILGNFLSLRIFLSFLAAIIASLVVLAIPMYSWELKIGVMIAAFSIGLNLTSITLSSVLQVYLKMTWNAFALVFGKALMLLYIWAVVTYDLGFIQLILAGLANNLIVLVLTGFFVLRFTKITLKWNLKEWKKLILSNLPYGLSITLPAVYMHLGPILLGQMRPEAVAQAEVGIYGVSLRIYELLILIPFAFMNSALPSIARSLKDKWRLNDIIQNSLDFLVILGLGILAGAAVLSPEIVGLVSKGEGFAPSAIVLRFLTLAMFFTFINNIFSYLLLSLEKAKHLLLINFVATVTALSLCFVLIPITGFWGSYNGLAIANVIPQIMILLGTFYVVRSTIELKLSYAHVWKALLAATLMFLTVYSFKIGFFSTWGSFKLIPLTLIGSVLYLAILYVLRAIPPQAWQIVMEYFERFKRSKTVPSEKVLKIAIDVRAIAGELTGKEWYALSLLQAIAKLDQHNQYYLYTKYRFDYELPENFHIVRRRLFLPLWHLWMICSMRWKGVDILFAPTSYMAPALNFFRSVKTVLVVHDTVAFLFPKNHQTKATQIERRIGKLAFKHADQIIAVSENTKRDLQKLFALPEDKITVIGEAARDSFRLIESKDELKRVCNKYEIPNKFILFVGTLEPRKNLVRLIKSYALLKEGLRNTYKLVIAGRKGWYYKETFEAIRECKLEEDVIFVGYVPDEDLPYILNAATLFVLPSLYEGFGLPLLEAFACGTPVVTSATGALKEVADDACLSFDPYDELQMADVIGQALEDKKLRNDLRAKGFQRLQAYSWEDVAQKILALLK
ncbi:MAG: glycosyltransferase [Candidatus Gracilibacteria bacterium]|nr:glycosyltransferase [Candidatus Gracilibacteria bacterium]